MLPSHPPKDREQLAPGATPILQMVGKRRIRLAQTGRFASSTAGAGMYDEFLHRLAEGDEEAWREAYPVLYREILSVLRARVQAGHGLDLEAKAADIIVREMMPALKERRLSYGMLKNFEELRAMGRTIACRRSVDMIRRAQRRKEDDLPENHEQILPKDESAHREIESLERFEELIGRLKPPKPELFRDHFYAGMTYQEISDLRGIPLGAVCSHFYRGFKALRNELNNDDTQNGEGGSHE